MEDMCMQSSLCKKYNAPRESLQHCSLYRLLYHHVYTYLKLGSDLTQGKREEKPLTQYRGKKIYDLTPS